MISPGDNWRPGASRHAIEARARLLGDIRAFFAERDVLEVETAVISPAGNVDPNIESVVTADDRYLRTSPEFMLKRLLAAGLRDVYEMGRVFRAGEAGRVVGAERRRGGRVADVDHAHPRVAVEVAFQHVPVGDAGRARLSGVDQHQALADGPANSGPIGVSSLR